jgi:hypothetical protein
VFEDQPTSEPASEDEDEDEGTSASALKDKLKLLERQLRFEQLERAREKRAAEEARRKLQLLQNQMQRMSTSRLPLTAGTPSENSAASTVSAPPSAAAPPLAAAAASLTAPSSVASASDYSARRPTMLEAAFTALEPDADDSAAAAVPETRADGDA